MKRISPFKNMPKNQYVYKLYICGNMENRRYVDLKYEHFYVVTQLQTIGIDVFDPLLKERHTPNKAVGLKTCGMKPKDVYYQDLGAVEDSDIIFWVTGDTQSEGSVTEVAWAGCWNAHKIGKQKLIVIVSPRRYSGELVHFSSMHKGAVVVPDVESGIEYIRKWVKR